MAEPKDYATLISQYNTYRGQGQTAERKREIAVTAALSLLDSHANGGGGGEGTKSPKLYKDEVAPLADAIQEALKHEE